MENTLTKLCREGIDPWVKPKEQTYEARKAGDRLDEMRKKATSTLSTEQNELFNDYIEQKKFLCRDRRRKFIRERF